MSERTYHNATHILTPITGDEPLRCHVLGKRGESMQLILFGAPGSKPREVFAAPNRVKALPSGVEDLL